MKVTYSRRNLHRHLVEAVGLRIVRGEIKAGETLPTEADLGAEFGVSRTVTREAIKVLAEKGMVESRPKVGTQVQPRQQWNLIDPDILNWEYEVGPREPFLHRLTELRLVIEPAAARMAASRATNQELALIQAAYERLAQSVAEIDEYINADMQFHAAIVNAAHNELLEQIVNTIRVALIASRKTTTQIPGASQSTLPLHYAVAEAVCKRDAQAAYRAMEYLINRVKEDIDQVSTLKRRRAIT